MKQFVTLDFDRVRPPRGADLAVTTRHPWPYTWPPAERMFIVIPHTGVQPLFFTEEQLAELGRRMVDLGTDVDSHYALQEYALVSDSRQEIYGEAVRNATFHFAGFVTHQSVFRSTQKENADV